jgi:hypothetical protein
VVLVVRLATATASFDSLTDSLSVARAAEAAVDSVGFLSVAAVFERG